MLLVLPADHVIRDVPAFQKAVRIALPAAEQGKLVTFGIVPSAPETGYGYIQRGRAGRAAPACTASRASSRSPIRTRRQQFVKSGEYYWNSGMFMFRARRYLQELERFAPEIAKVCATRFAEREERSGFHAHRCQERSKPVRRDSIDYAVMEKTSDAVVVPLDAGWSDVGSWSALHEACDADAPRQCRARAM